MKNKKEYSYKIWLPLLLALCTAMGMIIGHRFSSENLNSVREKGLTSKSVNEQTLQEVLKYIENRYVDSVNSFDLVEQATETMLSNLDPHSVYISPGQLNNVNEGMSGFYKGIGIETICYDDTLRVTRIIENSPASESGIKLGDLVIAVNDSILAGIGRSKEEQWEILRVKNDEDLQLEIIHENGEKRSVTIIPEKIKAPNVDYYSVNDVAYINILRFSDNTYEGIIDALEALQKDKIIESLILDLRDNPGGYLPEATKILNQFFIEDKRLLVYTEDRNERKSEYKTTGRPFYQINKIAVLVNEGSASASEVIAGALQDWDKAIIVGSKSFGKGLVQEQFNLSNGGALRLTTARYYTPSGRSIQKPYNDDSVDSTLYVSKELGRELSVNGGITPDFEVNWSNEELLALQEVSKNLSLNVYKIARKLKTANNLSDINGQQIGSAIENFIAENEELNKLSSKELIKSVLRARVCEMLELKEEADVEAFNYDIYIQEAQKRLKEKNIFADLM